MPRLQPRLLLASLIAPALLALARPCCDDPPAPREPIAEAFAPITPEQIERVWDVLKAMDGAWHGVSTKGWKEQLAYRTIAGRSVVMESSFDAHPGETMITMFHRNGPDLMLTHYCVAGNQPRLRATGITADGTTIEWTFLDATGMPSRNTGHMDRMLMKIDGDTHTEQWFWYADGKESPMEVITKKRVRDAAPAAPKEAAR